MARFTRMVTPQVRPEPACRAQARSRPPIIMTTTIPPTRRGRAVSRRPGRGARRTAISSVQSSSANQPILNATHDHVRLQQRVAEAIPELPLRPLLLEYGAALVRGEGVQVHGELGDL